MLNKKQIIEWARNTLIRDGYTINSPLEIIRELPWSSVARYSTVAGFVYLKEMAPPFANEPFLLQKLYKTISVDIPKVIAINPELNCFLMLDAGTVLRDNLKIHYRIDIVKKVLSTYAALQLKAISHVESLLSIGVNDWRLAKLPQLYSELMTEKQILISDGLTLSEFSLLQNLHSEFTDLCHQLSQYKIPETIEHGDFQDNNILIQQDSIVINDWGDAIISHPFFSLASWLNSAKRNHGLLETDKNTVLLQTVYLNNWIEYASLDKLLEAFSIAKIINHFRFTLSFIRITRCPGIEKYEQYKGYMANALREIINYFQRY